MESDTSFALLDCTLARWATGRSCSNLRELCEALRTVSDLVLEHHMMRCALEDHFELYEFANDLARWCWGALGDGVLGEQLGLVDPYQHDSIASLRAELINVIEERLWAAEHIAWCRPGLELHLVESRLLAWDTGERVNSITALAEALPNMSNRTLFFHVHEARRRLGDSDDFSIWLQNLGADEELVNQLRSVDFYFLKLEQLREEFSNTISHSLASEHGNHWGDT